MGNKVIIYTDGAVSGNGKDNACGGWAYMIRAEGADAVKFEYGNELNTTNNRMELTAVIRGLDAARAFYGKDVEIDVISDSAYVVNCYVNGWYLTWENNGWLTSKKEPVLNRDLWQVLIPYFRDKKVNFIKVKGHAGHKENEEVDKLAKRGVLEAKKS